MQGCQALEDIFLSGVQGKNCSLLSHMRMMIIYQLYSIFLELIDTVSVNIDMSDSGVHLTWTFPDTRSLQLSELATKGVKWFRYQFVVLLQKINTETIFNEKDMFQVHSQSICDWNE